jgi:hypothetical protein
LDVGGRPTTSYALLKNPTASKGAIADGIRKAYASLFDANEKANELAPEALKGLISQVAGLDEDMTTRVTSTFTALVKAADFKAQPQSEDKKGHKKDEETLEKEKPNDGRSGLRHEFYYNIQIHLPANGSEDTYLNIFNALRKTLR